ncbi:MAG: class F sortase [Actinomycetota bacterium]|nr:class F sortase [Actinomycetota bacterium]
MHRFRYRFRVVLAAGVVLGAAFAASGTTPGLAPAHAEADGAARAGTCRGVDHGFTPTGLSIPHVIGRTRVLGLGRDRRGVPRTPPLTDRGKWQFAWDKASGIRPGGRHGVVRLNAHTYPRDGSYGSALGNRLLTRLHKGARLIVTGRHDQRLCYRVVRRVAIRAGGNFAPYYSSTGPPRLAILVCSGTRRGPGDWSHRTIWWAEPTPTTTGQN